MQFNAIADSDADCNVMELNWGEVSCAMISGIDWHWQLPVGNSSYSHSIVDGGFELMS